MEKYDLVVIPVVDELNRLIGRITIDDVVDVIREEADKDYQLASGITEDVEITDSIWELYTCTTSLVNYWFVWWYAQRHNYWRL